MDRSRANLLLAPAFRFPAHLQSLGKFGHGPNSKTRSSMINEYPGFGLLDDAEKDRQWVLDEPSYRVRAVKHPRVHRALYLHRVVGPRPRPLSDLLQQSAIDVEPRVFLVRDRDRGAKGRKDIL